MKPFLKTLAAMIAVAAAYFFSGKFGLSLAIVNESATAVWPPTGIALATMLLRGYRLWPGIFVGAFLVNTTMQGSWGTSLGIELDTAGDRLCLSIRDKGRGYQVQENHTSGMGLRIMRYRALSIGGNLTIHSQAGVGTDVICIVPKQTSLP